MQPFIPWAWRDPAMLLGRDRLPEEGRGESIQADEEAGASLAGFHVEATDGGIGSIDEATHEVGEAYLVVDTGPWIFGRKVLLPAGTVQNVDHTERKVYVDRTKDQIKNSPEYDKETFGTPEYRERVGTYYTDSYRVPPPPL
ncbi:PRC-barrel domain-containing protein [Phytohabitans kaempferiae]|uniref:PRC-barrel domain-containing protein n=1 Tax=Phytohabitans kaempferiae TaxID=1620943 RepID=A0ABV6MFU8_9ACTN